MNRLLFYVKENQISPTYSSLNFFIFLLSGTERHTKLKLGPNMDSIHDVNVSCILELGCWYLFIPLFLQFSFFQIPKH